MGANKRMYLLARCSSIKHQISRLSSCVVQSTLSAGVYGIGVVSSSNTTVQDTAISDTNNALKVKSATNFTFSNNLVRSVPNGLFFNSGDGLKVDNNTIEGANGHGLTVESVNNVSINDNKLLNYSGESSQSIAPIEIIGSYDGEIRRNLIDASTKSGIVLSNTGRYIVDENNITDCAEYGIRLYGQALGGPHTISNNTVTSAQYGIWAEGANTSVENNVITDISWLGIHFSNSDDGRVVGNTVTSAWRGFEMNNCDRVTMTLNVISESAGLLGVVYGTVVDSRIWLNAFYDDGQSVVDYSNRTSWHFGGLGNYWSFVSGTDNDKNGRWDDPVSIPGKSSVDEFPLTSPIGPPSNMTLTAIYGGYGDYIVNVRYDMPQWLIGGPIDGFYCERSSSQGIRGEMRDPIPMNLNDPVQPGIGYTYEVYATRDSERGVAWSMNITLIDSTPPTVDVDDLEDGQWFTGLPIQINWTGSDDSLGIHHYSGRPLPGPVHLCRRGHDQLHHHLHSGWSANFRGRSIRLQWQHGERHGAHNRRCGGAGADNILAGGCRRHHR